MRTRDKDIMIAEFMGGKFSNGFGKTESRYYFEHNWYYAPMGYSSSWNSLMPVIKKIEDILSKEEHSGFGIFSQGVTIRYKGDYIYEQEIGEVNPFDSPEEVYKAVVAFLEWNKQLPPVCGKCGSDDIAIKKTSRRTGKPKGVKRHPNRRVSYGYKFERCTCNICEHTWEGKKI